ncbi:MAG: glutamate racemase [bacterium]
MCEYKFQEDSLNNLNDLNSNISRPIGIFDSGVGGLTVVKEVIKVMPNENVIYFGDTARVPYGSKSKETIYKFSCQIIRFLKKQNVKAIIIACNTVSSNCYEELKKEFHDIPIIEVLYSGVKSSISITQNNKIGVIGTEGTIRSNKYETEIKKLMPQAQVISKACPLFVPLAEEGFYDMQVTIDIAKIYLSDLDNKVDCLILGCTHYPLLARSIKKAFISNITIVNPALETANKMKRYLHNNNLENLNGGEHKFFVSDYTNKFHSICKKLLKNDYVINKIDIENY